MSQALHEAHGATLSIRFAIITCSDTRSSEDDTSGAFILDCLRQAGHELLSYQIVKDEPALIQGEVRSLVAQKADAILINGGTGLAARDTTFEALTALIERPIPGFGELFRMLSYQEIGAASLLSRAQAGIIKNTLLFSMPGSKGAVHLAMKNLILPQLGHMVAEIRK
ncbi:MAG: molybdenum cofactor biosynthesis protein MoaB [Rhodothermales bacterium]|nr:molybdenum cofactor biosynthesis protein MoaB [Rhodothermales bacterium]MDG2016391.1 molybdenum cofactor biosynthesis protein MoaB [Rhodothermales bacterium]HAY36024.1 molybdenum cofactor biosynthesis protein [Bacteroidota bacterium]